MKILLIDVIDEQEKSQAQYYSLGLGYISSYLKKYIRKGIDIKIINSNIEEEILSFKPDIVGLSSVSQNFNRTKKIAKFCKEKGITIIVGKSHISSIPSCLDENMDVGVIGEGEETFKELVELFIKKKFTKERLREVKGIIFHDGKKIIQTEKRPFIKNLDSLPLPDREILNIKRGDEIYLFSSRGCPYRCKFCFSSRFWDTTRFFSAQYVLKEVKYLIDKYKPTRINFYDDLFIADKNRLREIVMLIKKEKFYKKVRFTVSVRANLVNDESARLLRELGVDIVNMGLESGNERILNYLKGNSVTIEDNQNSIKYFKKYGIQVSASFIIGSPDETREEIFDTLNFIKNSKLDMFDVYVLTPLPGTPIWEYALQKGLVFNNIKWDKLNVDFSKNYKNSIILSEKLTCKEIKQLYDVFLKERKRRYYKLMVKSVFTRTKEMIPFIKRKLFN